MNARKVVMKLVIATTGWSIVAILMSIVNYDHDQWVRDQELEFIQQGLINPFEGLENVQRNLAHNEPEDPGPLSPEEQEKYDKFMASQKSRWQYDEDLGPMPTRPYAGGN